MMKKIGKKVFVAMSGGVDSSVAAALLKEQGFEVAGVFMRFWSEGAKRDNVCCSVEAEAAALAVAQKLRIPFYVFNFEKEFKRAVADDFLAKERIGLTPNPCVVCNPKIKFGLFLEKALASGADYVATGHYARLRREFPISRPAGDLPQGDNFHPSTSLGIKFLKKIQNPKSKKITRLLAAKDKLKDQSYFLYGLNQAQLSKIIFPLGEFKKTDVVKLAKKWGLPFWSHESFDLCFVGASRDKFIKKHLGLKSGKIVKSVNKLYKNPPQPSLKGGNNAGSPPLGGVRGDFLGVHQGLPLYTIGQRAAIGGPGPFYVVKKDVKNNILYVSNKEKDLFSKEMMVGDVNWIGGRAPKLPLKCKVKIRYQSEVVAATLRLRSGQKLQVIFAKPQRAITPGQSAVFYGQRGEVLGGGIIEK